jgi:hypothetical protein
MVRNCCCHIDINRHSAVIKLKPGTEIRFVARARNFSFQISIPVLDLSPIEWILATICQE